MSATTLPRHAPQTLEQLGRYRIQAELGRGAMGIVYRARDPVIDREVAIKTIRIDLARDELARFETRFFTEVRAAGRLSHPNIVTVHDAGRESGLVYVTMELLEGPSLADLLAAHTPVAPARIATIGAQIADALAYAHAQGIVHRDVKPANIILVRDQVPKLTDFGVARLPSAASTLAGTLVGSPRYMSPEQITAQAMDGRSDVFSLGVVLYELLTGEAAFEADSLHAVMHRVVTHAPPSPATLNPRVPAALDRIVCRAIAKRPEDRYPTARALAVDLKRFVRGELVTDASWPAPTKPATHQPAVGAETLELKPRAGTGPAPAIDPPPPSRTAGRRRHVVAALAATVLVSALAGAWIFREHAKTAAAVTIAPAPAVRIETVAASPSPADAAADGRPTDAAPAAEPAQSAAARPASTTSSSPSTARADTPALAATTVRPRPRPPVAPAPPKERLGSAAGGGAPSPALAPHAPEAKLMLAIAPWGEVYVDGQRMGITPPLNELTVLAGRRKIEIRNADLKPHIVMLDLRPDSAIKIKHQFR
ncbi:MAG: serine/threonine protein kinase [Burkholderiales bacterium]|nr:serine/threonine protein kinase [Burkholderiales bacterium]